MINRKTIITILGVFAGFGLYYLLDFIPNHHKSLSNEQIHAIIERDCRETNSKPFDYDQCMINELTHQLVESDIRAAK